MNAIMRAANQPCEFCGKASPASHYAFVAEVDFAIYLDSPEVQRHDRASHMVMLSDGQTLEYDFLCGDIALNLKAMVLPHIFCSEKCEEEFTSHHPIRIPGSDVSVLSCSGDQMSISWPVVLQPEAVRFSMNECAKCHTTFPNINKVFEVYRIQDTKVIEGVHGRIGIPSGYDLGQSNTKQDGDRGNFVFYKLRDRPGDKNPKITLCSDSCAFVYATEKNSVLYYPNNVLQGFIAVMTPFAVEMNRGLGNAYKYRPHKAFPMR